MYHDFFHLKDEPFNLTPDTRFLYMTAQHREALNHLMYGIAHRKGFICLTGEVGTGKTLLCRALLNRLGKRYHTALVLNPVLDRDGLLKTILAEFGISSKPRDLAGYFQVLNRYLLKVHAAGHDAVLLIDEAQDMPDETLELTRLLSNFETESRKLVQIILVGQPELRVKLRQDHLRQLNQRITVKCHLKEMSQAETDAYIHHRLATAGAGTGLRFDRAAVKEIHRFSRGTPRLINALSDKALLAGFVYQTEKITRKLVRRAMSDLKETA